MSNRDVGWPEVRDASVTANIGGGGIPTSNLTQVKLLRPAIPVTATPAYLCINTGFPRAAKSRTQKRVNNAIRNEWINQTAANNH
jgi:hypothetical protein